MGTSLRLEGAAPHSTSYNSHPFPCCLEHQGVALSLLPMFLGWAELLPRSHWHLPLGDERPVDLVEVLRGGSCPAVVENDLEPGEAQASDEHVASWLPTCCFSFLTYLSLKPLASTPANMSEPISDVSTTKGASFMLENLAFFRREKEKASDAISTMQNVAASDTSGQTDPEVCFFLSPTSSKCLVVELL